ncbi:MULTISPECIES: flagella synthesis protein FlgN [Halomonadaceae]|uniref:flagella synthesis protein FlgN n=1 Tax=Halomonadaceae TaxID=28256 RepID=UPI001597D569|nr:MULTISPECIES: flagellar protein FlgN [Halomonas]QJQ94422.1 flagellar protein FlgN [Halomonas sp. PA5]
MSLAAHLTRQHQRLEALVTSLLEEREALIPGQIDGQRLNGIATIKQELLAELDQLEAQRRKAQHKLGYADGLSGAEEAARDYDCLGEWSKMRELTERARRLNELNGELIQGRLRLNQRTLNFLHDVTGKTLYGPDGQAPRQRFANVSSKV